DSLAVVAGGDCRYRRLKRTGLLDALGLHVFEELRPDLGLLDQLDNGLGLGLIDSASVSVVIIADHHDVEDVAGDITAKERLDELLIGLNPHDHLWQYVMPTDDVDPAALRDVELPLRTDTEKAGWPHSFQLNFGHC